MFDRYTEDARLAIFWARYEASAFGSPEIDVTHLLLGLIREGHGLLAKFGSAPGFLDLLRDRTIAAIPGSSLEIPTSANMPLSTRASEVLERAAQESEQLGNSLVTLIHLLLALEREPATEGILRSAGVEYDAVLRHAKSAVADDGL